MGCLYAHCLEMTLPHQWLARQWLARQWFDGHNWLMRGHRLVPQWCCQGHYGNMMIVIAIVIIIIV